MLGGDNFGSGTVIVTLGSRPVSCVVTTSHTTIQCTSPPGVGVDLAWSVTVGGVSSPAVARTCSYVPPTVTRVWGPGAVGASTEGGQLVLVTGSG